MDEKDEDDTDGNVEIKSTSQEISKRRSSISNVTSFREKFDSEHSFSLFEKNPPQNGKEAASRGVGRWLAFRHKFQSKETTEQLHNIQSNNLNTQRQQREISRRRRSTLSNWLSFRRKFDDGHDHSEEEQPEENPASPPVHRMITRRAGDEISSPPIPRIFVPRSSRMQRDFDRQSSPQPQEEEAEEVPRTEILLLPDSNVFNIDNQKACDKKWIATCFIFALLALSSLIFGLFSRRSDTGSDKSSIPTFSPKTSLHPTLAPTNAPTSIKFMAIKAIVESATDSSQQSSLLSPRLRAIKWLAYEDEIDLDLSDVNAVLQRFAVVAFFFSTSINFSIEDNNRPWCNLMEKQKHECDWNAYSEYYSNLYKWPVRYLYSCGILCLDHNNEHRVTHISVDPETLNGTLPEEIGLLSKLQRLEIQNNFGLTGSLPQSLFFGEASSSLTHLILFFNQLTGTIPSAPLLSSGSDNNESTSTPGLQQLRELYLSWNRLAGTIPFHLGLLPNLRSLVLSYNELTGTIPSSLFVSNQPRTSMKLRDLFLQSNFLEGTLPISSDNDTLVSSSVSPLIHLAVSENFLNGTIPNTMFTHFSNLVNISLDTNFFSGTVSSEFGSLMNLQALFMGKNQFSGTIPPSLMELSAWDRLEYLDLNENMLTGTIPTVKNISDPKFVYLDLSDNQIVGSIPRELFTEGAAKYLRYLYLGVNQLNGTIPTSLGQATNLQVLSLNGNEIHGTVPYSFVNLTSLGVLLLAYTKLEGTMDFLDSLPLSLSIADCREPNPRIVCSFCNVCCDDVDCYVRGTDVPFEL